MTRILLALTLMALAALPGAAQQWKKANIGMVWAQRDEINGCMAIWIPPDIAAIGKWWHAKAVVNKVRQVVWNDDWQLEVRYTRRNGAPPKMYQLWKTMMKKGQVVEGREVSRSRFLPYNKKTWPAVMVTPKMWDMKDALPKTDYSHAFYVEHCGFAGDQKITVRIWAVNSKTGERVRVVKGTTYMPWMD